MTSKNKLIIISINLLIFAVNAMPTSDNNEDSQTISDVTPYPDTQKRYIDLSNVSPEVSDIMIRNNLNIEQIREQQERLRNSYTVIPSSTAETPASEE